ncbi:MAG: threonine--tRNA ligase [Candidatus Wallbacteria bacterium]|nr:threonine--tRNA ligase [Candidatus Wallbacteria bacterium]
MGKIMFQNQELEINEGQSIGETILARFPRYKKEALAVSLNGELRDLSAHFPGNLAEKAKAEIIDFEKTQGKEVFWHSTSHLMAQAVKRIWPKAQLAIGPAIEEGFYYDIDLESPISEEDLAKIEAGMRKVAEEDLAIRRTELPIDEAIAKFRSEDNKYKVEMLEALKTKGETSVSLYSQGEFTDLCRGPHLSSTSQMKHYKLLKVAGAYWRGDERNRMLQRIYGISFPKKSQLDEHITLLEEAKKRDHRVLGRDLKLFITEPETAGAGLILYLPYGTALKTSLENFLKAEHRRRGYQMVATPHIYNANLWKISGHYGFYHDNMYFFNIEEEEYAVKPMNCPGHVLIYGSQLHSYKELPIKFFELGTVYRHEKSGVMHGLLRVRGFTQDDAHIFCLQSQLKDEIKKVMDLADYLMKLFNFEYKLEISTRPEKFIGEVATWDLATQALKDALEEMKLPYEINEGDGAFYGPKIDLKVRDALKRTWQCSTIQVDFNFPERFNLHYIDEKGEKQRPIMVHRAIVGSLERFIGVLIEHLNGKFPFWLSPVQIRVLTITDRHNGCAHKIYEELFQAGYRVEEDLRSEKVNYKIREAQMMKVPFMVVIGDEEVESGKLTVRTREGEHIKGITLAEFKEMLVKLVI